MVFLLRSREAYARLVWSGLQIFLIRFGGQTRYQMIGVDAYLGIYMNKKEMHKTKVSMDKAY